MKKVIIFAEEQVMQMQYMLNAVTVTGIQNAKQVAAIAQMLELGTPGEVGEPDQPIKFKGIYSPCNWISEPAELPKAFTASNNARPAKSGGEG